jgi:hypothetical protein
MTVPVGELPVTVAVSASALPAVTGFGEAAIVVVLAAPVPVETVVFPITGQPVEKSSDRTNRKSR